uniref:Zinc finger protein NUTCRACKER-like n=1 Tax=Rhizophora mucronata TaxID=61149 RepID=A0A2P2M5I0_RHIMU
MSKVTADGGSFPSEDSSGGGGKEVQQQEILNHHLNSIDSSITTTTNNSNGSTTTQVQQALQPTKRKRNMPGNPDPSAEVIALSPNSLTAENRFFCEICNKGFQRDQNLQLHRRGHNLPWKLKQRTGTEVKKKVYVCPQLSCVHHNPARALGDLTGIKKHFSRKHGEKKWKCDKCSKKYAVQSDWKAHVKTCGTKEYKCDCGTIFSRRDSFITHRAFCDALAEENTNTKASQGPNMEPNIQSQVSNLVSSMPTSQNSNPSAIISNLCHLDTKIPLPLPQVGSIFSGSKASLFKGARSMPNSSSPFQLNTCSSTFEGKRSAEDHLTGSASMSATALLQKAALMSATASSANVNSPMRMAPSAFCTTLQPQNHQIQVAGSESEFFSQMFNAQGGVDENSVLRDTGMFAGGFLDQSCGLLKNMEQDSGNTLNIFYDTSSVNPGLSTRDNAANTGALSRFSGDALTVDFLGIGGSRPRNLLEEQNHEMGYRGIAHLGMQGLNHFEQRATVAKSLWDV